MKIVYVVPNLRSCGPINVLIVLAKNLSKENDIFIITIFGNKDEKIIIDQLEKHNIRVESLKLSNRQFIYKGLRNLKKALKNFTPDIVHSHGLQADMLVSMLGKKYKKVTTIHSNIVEDYNTQFGGALSKVFVKYRLNIMRKFDDNICCSECVKNEISELTKARIDYVRNGVEIPSVANSEKMRIRNTLRKDLSIPLDAKVFVYCGGITKGKCVSMLIKLFCKHSSPNEYLIIVGDGDELLKCEQVKNNNVKLVGKKNAEEVKNYYIAGDIYVSNSMSEGLSMSILEALSFGNYLLLSTIQSHLECLNLIEGGCYGRLFTESNFNESYHSVLELIDQNRRNDFDKYIISGKRMSDEYLRKYNEVLRNE